MQVPDGLYEGDLFRIQTRVVPATALDPALKKLDPDSVRQMVALNLPGSAQYWDMAFEC